MKVPVVAILLLACGLAHANFISDTIDSLKQKTRKIADTLSQKTAAIYRDLHGPQTAKKVDSEVQHEWGKLRKAEEGVKKTASKKIAELHVRGVMVPVSHGVSTNMAEYRISCRLAIPLSEAIRQRSAIKWQMEDLVRQFIPGHTVHLLKFTLTKRGGETVVVIFIVSSKNVERAKQQLSKQIVSLKKAIAAGRISLTVMSKRYYLKPVNNNINKNNDIHSVHDTYRSVGGREYRYQTVHISHFSWPGWRRVAISVGVGVSLLVIITVIVVAVIHKKRRGDQTLVVPAGGPQYERLNEA